MIVEIRPIDRKTWHGKSGKDSFGAPVKLEVLVDAKTNRYATGLSPELEEKYSKMLGVTLDSNLRPVGTPHPYWSTEQATITLPNHTIFFNTDSPTEDIKIHNLKVSKFVANSMAEYEAGLYPEATHVIFSEEEEAHAKAAKLELQYEAISLATKLTKDEKIDVILILGNKNLRGSSDNLVNVSLDTIVREKTKQFIILVKSDKKRRALKALILEAIHRNVLTKEGVSIYYLSERIGYDMEEAIDFLSNDNNQKVKAHIIEQLTA